MVSPPPTSKTYTGNRSGPKAARSPRRLEVADDPPHRAQRQDRPEDLAGPRAGRQHEAAGPHPLPADDDLDAVGGQLPALDHGLEAEVGVVRGGDGEVGAHGVLGADPSGHGLEHRLLALGEAELRVADRHRGPLEPLVGERPPRGTAQRPGDHLRVGRAQHQAADAVQQRPPGRRPELVPQLVGPPGQRHVVGVLEVRLADDAGLAVRRAEGVGRPELLDAEHAHAPPGQVGGGGRPHPTQAEDDHVGRSSGPGRHRPGTVPAA